MTQRDIFVVGTARTAIGTFGGSLKDVPNTQLATTAVKAAIERSGVTPDAIGHVVMGNVIPTDVKDAYLSRVAAIDAGCPIETPAFNVNRLCGSGLQAIVSAAQAIALGDCDIASPFRIAADQRSPRSSTQGIFSHSAHLWNSANCATGEAWLRPPGRSDINDPSAINRGHAAWPGTSGLKFLAKAAQ